MKASDHFGKAAAEYKSAGTHLGKAAEHAFGQLKEAAAKGLETVTLKKADVDKLIDHMNECKACMGKGADHMDIGSHNLGKVTSGFASWSGEPGDISAPSAGDEYDSTRPVFGRGAGYSQDVVEQLVKAEKEKGEALARAAAAEARAEAYKAMPAGPRKGFAFPVEKGFGGGAGDPGGDDRLTSLMKGVNVDTEDPDSIAAGATKMLANMFASPGKFARSVMDPSFHGQAGGKTN